MKTSIAMKTRILSVVCFLLIAMSGVIHAEASTAPGTGQANELTIYSTSSLLDLTTRWAANYQAAYPDQMVKVTPYNQQSTEELSLAGRELLFTSSLASEANLPAGSFHVLAGREIIVPVMNTENPYIMDIRKSGIPQETFIHSMMPDHDMTWGTLLSNDMNRPVTYYVLANDLVRVTVDEFLNIGESGRELVVVQQPEELISAIRNNPYAIGFCRVTDIIDPVTGLFLSSVAILPIDKNGNGIMDYMEQIYSTPQDFFRAVWIGKYPRNLVQNVYGVVNDHPVSEANLAFIQWVLTAGQPALVEDGFTGLMTSEAQAQLSKLDPAPMISQATTRSYSTGWVLLLGFVGLLLLGGIIHGSIWLWRGRSQVGMQQAVPTDSIFDESQVVVPGGLFFDKSHTWAFMEQDGSVKLGIDDFLQHVVGPVSRVEMKQPGERIRKGEVLCTLVQEGKRLNIFAPVSGTIDSLNEQLAANLSALNQSPYQEGWLYRVVPDNWTREITFLSMGQAYRQWLSNEFSRLKDFLSTIIPSAAYPSPMVVLQEGGHLKDHVLADLGPAVWEDFQETFLQKTH